jgi:transcription-repair coupling factor (superfamily II helicase)
MLEELIDRFGEPPGSVLNLLEITRIRGQAHELYMKEIRGRNDQILFIMYEKAGINPARIPELIGQMKGALTFKKTEPVQFVYQIGGRQEGRKNLLELTAQILDRMKILLEA